MTYFSIDKFQSNGAHFSDCRNYRFILWRIWDTEKPAVMFIGLNPSTANENEDDPTIKKVIKIAANNGFGAVYMLNCFPYISTDPSIMAEFYNTTNHERENIINNRHLVDISKLCSEIVFAWGSFKVATAKGLFMNECFPNAKALHINKNGSPKHPLYCRDNQTLIPFKG